MTQAELESKLTVLLGGRAAEQLVFGMWSTGAADDLAKATEIARHMVAGYGMDAHLGHATYETERSTFLGAPADLVERRRFSEETARAIDESVRAIVNAAFERALALLESHRAVLEAGARKLLAEETLERDELDALRAEWLAAGAPSGGGPVSAEPAAPGSAGVRTAAEVRSLRLVTATESAHSAPQGEQGVR
jgi:cell division protease FtsH